MPSVKRRIIYMEDKTWQLIRAEADKLDLTMSEVMRRAVDALITPKEGIDRPVPVPFPTVPSGDQRAPAGIGQVSTTKATVPVTDWTVPIVPKAVTSEKPFRQFKPVPKPGGKISRGK